MMVVALDPECCELDARVEFGKCGGALRCRIKTMRSLYHSPWGTYKPTIAAALALRVGRSFTRAKTQKRLLRLLPSSRAYDISVDGIRLRCHVSDNTTETELIAGRDQKELSAILQCLNTGDTFFDVGANCGLFALMASRKIGPLGRVIAIEPSREMVQRLRFNLDANGFTNIKVIEAAVGAETGSATLYVDTKQRGKSSLYEMEACASESVPVMTLLSIVDKTGVERIDVMKIDIEGCEDRALLPFIETAPKRLWPLAIFMETRWASRWRDGCLVRLLESGYRLKYRTRNDALLVRGFR